MILPPQGIGSLITGLREVGYLKSGYLATRLKDIGLTKASIHGKRWSNFGSLFMLSFNSPRYNQSLSFFPTLIPAPKPKSDYIIKH